MQLGLGSNIDSYSDGDSDISVNRLTDKKVSRLTAKHVNSEGIAMETTGTRQLWFDPGRL